MNGFSAFIKEIPESSLSFLLCKDTANYEPGKRPIADTEICQWLDLRLPAFRIARNKYLLFNPADCGDWLQQSERIKTPTLLTFLFRLSFYL